MECYLELEQLPRNCPSLAISSEETARSCLKCLSWLHQCAKSQNAIEF